MQAPGLLSIEESMTHGQGSRPEDGTLDSESLPAVRTQDRVGTGDDHRTRLVADSVLAPLTGNRSSLCEPHQNPVAA